MSGKESGVKTLFLIANYFSGVVVGLSLFAIGLGGGLMMEMSAQFIVLMVIGLLVFLLSFVGHCGALHDNRKTLDGYSFLMFVFASFEVRHLIQLRNDLSPGSKLPHFLGEYFIFFIFITAITIFSTLLAATLSAEIRSNEKKSNAASTARIA